MDIRKIIQEEVQKMLQKKTFSEKLDFASTEGETPMIIQGPKGYFLGMASKGAQGNIVTRSIESPMYRNSQDVCKFFSNWDPTRAAMEESVVVEDGGQGYNVIGDPQQVCSISEDNFPAGAQHDDNAPYNEKEKSPGQKASSNKYGVVWYGENAGITLVEDDAGNLYGFNTDSIDIGDYAPYASREEELIGFEDGIPDVEYGEWELDGDIIENYINDNIESISIGNGLDDFDSGANMALVDDAFRQDLIGLSKHITNNKEEFHNIVTGSIEEEKISDKIVDKKTMDTPTGTLFVMSMGESVHGKIKNIINEFKKDNTRRD